jgi:hypothetical protein
MKISEVNDSLENIDLPKLSNEIKTVYWVIGIAMAIILIALARK